jgi:8-oxo-dGTP pyrophosphatase MutT (NUDIX family)
MTSSSTSDLTPIEAAGGLVLRRTERGTEVLMIHRRGVWDLPKGKPDRHETPAECARREVREETGAENLEIVRGAGMTLHTYEESGLRILKTTWWFIMTTSSTKFVPQATEQIERVDWVPWSEAREIVGYQNLRRHMEAIEPMIEGRDREVA